MQTIPFRIVFDSVCILCICYALCHKTPFNYRSSLLNLYEVHAMILLCLLAFAALVSASAVGFHIGYQIGEVRGLARGQARPVYTSVYNRHRDS